MAAVSYPGVYVNEVRSSVRPITGVSTSITAFVGAASRGTPDVPVTLHSFADYQRAFGSFTRTSHLAYSVSDFFRLGGGTAVAVRAFAQTAQSDTGLASYLVHGIGSQANKGVLTLTAKWPGSDGNALGITLARTDGVDPDHDLYTLTLHDPVLQKNETYKSLRLTGAANLVDAITSDSLLVRAVLELAEDSGTKSTPRFDSIPATAHAALGGGNDGKPLDATVLAGDQAAKTGLYALENEPLFNLLVVPPYPLTPGDSIEKWDVHDALLAAIEPYVVRRRAVYLQDPPASWKTKALAQTGMANPQSSNDHVAQYFPRLLEADPRTSQTLTLGPAGAIAGVIAATDAGAGPWQAPAGLNASLGAGTSLAVPLTDLEIGDLNPLGLNCLRRAPAAGNVVWGARTRRGADALADPYKYLPVRRTALFIEESLYEGIQWAVFQPNDEPLWAALRLNIGAFMHDLFQQHAFAGMTARDAYFVACDSTTTTQNDIDRGIVNIVVGFAPLKPAEFVVLNLTQIAGQIAV
jgi:phage tail sheath protein FI